MTKRTQAASRFASARLQQLGNRRFWSWLKAERREIEKKLGELRRMKQTQKVSRSIARVSAKIAWISLVREEAEKLRPAPARLPTDRELRRRKVGLLAREGQVFKRPS